MSDTLLLEIPKEIYDTLIQISAEQRKTPVEWIAENVSRQSMILANNSSDTKSDKTNVDLQRELWLTQL